MDLKVWPSKTCQWPPKFSMLLCLFRVALIILHEEIAQDNLQFSFSLPQLRKMSATKAFKKYSVTSAYCIVSLVIWKTFQVQTSCSGTEGADLDVKTQIPFRKRLGALQSFLHCLLVFRQLVILKPRIIS